MAGGRRGECCGGTEAGLANGVRIEVAGVISLDRRIVRALRIRFVA